MYKRNTSKWLKHWDFILLDFVLIQCALIITYYMRHGTGNPYESIFYRNMAVIVSMLDVCLSLIMDNYEDILKRGYWKEFVAVFKHVSAVTIGLIVYLFMMQYSEEYSRLMLFFFPVISGVFLYFGRVILKRYLRSHARLSMKKRALMLVGTESNYEQLTDNFLNNPYSEFQLMGIGMLNRPDKKPDNYREITILYGNNAILNYLQRQWVDEVMFSMSEQDEYPESLIEKCEIMGLTVHIQLTKIDGRNNNQVVEQIAGYTVLSSSIYMATPIQMMIKRLLDIIGSLVGLVLAIIIGIVIGPILFVQSPGPILFTQVRVGRNGRLFKIYKFRSMYMDAEARKGELAERNNIKDGMMFKMDDDPRIIKGIGHFIREHSLDEFPQFWNVLKGDMSLVGTRPPTVDEWEKYELHHRMRLAIKPGLTGLWQVSGRSCITDFEEVVKLDTQYIREWNFGKDIRIILQTILVCLTKNGAR